jgi:DNA-3-methyladenine glycosylase
MSRIASLDFDQPSVTVARALIGTTLLIGGIGGLIVETEAYDVTEPASHTFRGERPHNAALFGPSGRAYVYRSYGIHWCLNFVCCEAGHGAGVLIRAIEPTAGLEEIRRRRGLDDIKLLCSGPGRLGQALDVSKSFDGKRLDRPPFELLPAKPHIDVVAGVRIGITKAMDLPWRFGLQGSAFLSRPFK